MSEATQVTNGTNESTIWRAAKQLLGAMGVVVRQVQASLRESRLLSRRSACSQPLD
jgi:hypothetical protein